MNKNTKASHPALAPVNDSALVRESWKVFQIMAEFVEGFERLAAIRPAVSIFGSARFGAEHPYYKLAEEIGYSVSDAGFSVVTGGGPGIMEAANKGAYSGRSPSIGLNMQLRDERGNAFQDIRLNFRHFFPRKVMFVKYASAYVVLPGGFGTLDELAEILTLVQIGKTRKIPIILVGSDFWRGLIEWFKNTLVGEATIDATDIDLFEVVDHPREVVDAIFRHYEHREFALSPEEQEMHMHL